MAKGRLNLSVILKHLDSNNFEVYECYRQNEADRKEFDRMLAYILPLWMSGVQNGRDQVALTLAFNQHVNIGWRELDGHHELRAKVLAAIGPGKPLRHDFHLREQRKQNALTELLVRRYPDIRKDEVGLWCRRNSEANLIDLARDHGLQQKDIDRILEEYRRVVT